MIQVISVFQFVIYGMDSQLRKDRIMALPAQIKEQVISQVLGNLGPRDMFEDSLGLSIVGNVVNQSVKASNEAQSDMAIAHAATLEKLASMGYDQNSDLVRNLNANLIRTQAVSSLVAEKLVQSMH